MATFDFKTLFEQLKKEVSNLAVTSVGQFKKEAETDAQNLLENLKQKPSGLDCPIGLRQNDQ